MSSMFGTAFQVTNTIVEMLFILDHRLRDHAKQYRSLKRVCDDSKFVLLHCLANRLAL
jgi:hypothetical protein